MNEKEKYLNLYDALQCEKSQADIIPGQMGGGYGRICWGENMLETLKYWKIASLLDVGCGHGNFCDAASLFVPQVYGLDIASVATGNVIDNPEITYLDGEAKALPLPDNAVEWITSFDCLEHCLEQDVDKILEEFNRVARSGFVLSISYEPCEMEGLPLHMTVKPESWWIEKLSRFGQISKVGKTPITGAPYLICRKPVEKTILCYCAGSLGTRLRGLALADRLARQSGRRLRLVWLANDPLCRCAFSSLFNNPIARIDEMEMLDLPSCKIYAGIKDVADQALISGGKILRTAIQKWGASEIDTISMDDPEEHIILFAPKSQFDFRVQDSDNLLFHLSPTNTIQQRIQELIERLAIDKDLIGVHARGTDFGIPSDAYADQMKKALNQNADQKFLVCSDDRTYEQSLRSEFPGQVIVRPKSAWPQKKNAKLPWALGNIDTSEASVVDALVDLYLLAHTRFEIYHESSAYAQTGAILFRRCEMGQNRKTVDAHAHECGLKSPIATKSRNHHNGGAIYYVCPDVALKSAGIRRLYRHVSVLDSTGFNAFILHQKMGFRINDLPAVPVRYLEQEHLKPNDIVVIPEGCPAIMAALKDHPVRRFVIALNWDYVFKVLPPGTDWRAFNIERVISVSSSIAEMVSWSMGLPTHLLASSIDHRLYYFDKSNKQPHVVYIARKGTHADRLKRLLGARNPAFTNDFKWIGLDGLTENEYADHIRRAAVFLNLSLAEGYPTSFLEAMASGTLVAGYRSMGANTLLCGEGTGQNCLLTPIGDYPALAYALEPFLTALCTGEMSMWNRVLSNGLEAVSGLTAEAEAHALISFWRNICSDATAIGEGNEAKR